MSVATGPPDVLAERRARAARTVAPFADEYPFEGRWHDLGGAWMHYLDQGPEDAAPLLCLHGNPTWSFFFRRFARELAGAHRMIVPDHVGCGLSDKPQDWPYTLEQHVLDLERLVLALDLRRITLVLHDWGGAIGMGLARRHPDRIARLLVLNTAAFPSRAIPLRISICRIPVLGELAVRGLGGFSRAALGMAVEKPLSRAARRAYLAPYDSWKNRVATLAFVHDIPLDPGHPSYSELRAIGDALAGFADRPACIVWGERDWCFTPAFREEWQRRLPAAEVHPLADAGHYVMEDAGERVIAIAREFLARRAPAAAREGARP